MRARALAGVARSAAWIAAIQAVNFLVPLAALPFLVRGLGVGQFSLYAVLMACAACLAIFADFSFNVTGPIRAGRARAEGRLAALLLDATLLKAALVVPAGAVFLLAAMAVAGAGPLDAALALGHGVLLTMTPRWLVYGLGRLGPFALLSAGSRLAWLGVVAWQVREPGDLTLVLAASALAQGATMAGSFVLVWPGGGGARPGLRGPARMLGEDLGQFGAILAASGARELNLLMLSAFAPAPDVASYALADRMRLLMVGLVAPVTQAIYLAIVGGNGRETGFRGPASLLVLVASAAGGALVFALAGPVVQVLGGGEVPGAVPVLRVLCLLPFLSGLTAILGTNTLLVEGRADAYAATQTAVALLGMPLTVLAIVRGGAVGAAWAAVAQEAALALLYALALRRSGLLARVLR